MRGHGFAAAARSLIEVVRMSVYLPRNARALWRAKQLGGEIKYLSQGEIDARNRGYSPYSVETWRAWHYWANKAGVGDHGRPDRTKQTMKLASYLAGGKPAFGLVTDMGVITLSDRLGDVCTRLREALQEDGVLDEMLNLAKGRRTRPAAGGDKISSAHHRSRARSSVSGSITAAMPRSTATRCWKSRISSRNSPIA